VAAQSWLTFKKSAIQSNLNLVLPPTLILLDSTRPNVRTRTMVILSNFLDRIDETFLARTGLSEVFWTAMLPNLSSVPPVTDIDDSVSLLRVTYPTMIKLAKIWYPSPPQRAVPLDTLVRDGVIYGMMFAGDKLKVAQVELDALDLLVREMGIYFVKHLKVLPSGCRLLTYST
jgi:Tti2 family